jgi:hypothetical protein
LLQCTNRSASLIPASSRSTNQSPYSFRQALPLQKPLPKRVVGIGSSHQCPSRRRLQVAKKLLEQRAVIRAELAILGDCNGSVSVRSRELKVSMVKQERVRSAAHVRTDELEPQQSGGIVENRCAVQPAFLIEINNLRRLAVQDTVVAQASVEESGNAYFEHDSASARRAGSYSCWRDVCQGLARTAPYWSGIAAF